MKLFAPPPVKCTFLLLTLFSFFNPVQLCAQLPFWTNSGNNTNSSDFLGTNNSQSLVFKTNGIERLRILPNGYVGIGTNNPLYSLHVIGDAYFTGIVNAQGVVLTNKLLADTMKAGSMFELNNNLHMSAGGINEIYTATGNLRFQSNAGNNNNTIFSAGTNGSVGIGTFSPQAKLDVNGSLRVSGGIKADQFANQGYGYVVCSPTGDFLFYPDPDLDPGNPNSCTSPFDDWGLNGNANTNPNTDFVGTCDATDFVLRTSNLERMRILQDGKVGVGTNSPVFPFQVNVNQSLTPGAPAAAFVAQGNNTSGSIFLLPSATLGSYNPLVQQGDYGIFWNDGVAPDGKNQSSSFVIAPWSDQSNSGLRITSAGNVGIGMSYPAFKLDVCGVIRAKEVRVEMTGCDYVFDTAYALMPIDSLKNYISQNKHLPGVEPAAKMETAEGVELGKFNTMYLSKIEELTLYIIELDGRIKELEAKDCH